MTSTETIPARTAAAWDMPTPDVLTAAADLLDANGLHRAFWRHGVLRREHWADERARPWRPGLPLSPVGAIGAARGLRQASDVTWHVIGAVLHDDQPCDPAVVALWEHLGGSSLQDLWRWTDIAVGLHVAAAMRDVAAWLDEKGAAA